MIPPFGPVVARARAWHRPSEDGDLSERPVPGTLVLVEGRAE